MYREQPARIISSLANTETCGKSRTKPHRKEWQMRKIMMLVALDALMVALVAGKVAAKQNGNYRVPTTSRARSWR